MITLPRESHRMSQPTVTRWSYTLMMMPHVRSHQRGFSMIEVVISTALVVILLALLLPALTSARVLAHRDQCSDNLRQLGMALGGYMEDHHGEFPFVPGMSSWHYGGIRYSSATGEPFLDSRRPLNRWLGTYNMRGDAIQLFCCPADYGIVEGPDGPGTGGRTACRAFGTSYRANPNLFDVRNRGMTQAPRGMKRAEITTAPSRLLVMGDPIWFESLESSGRNAAWHRHALAGNILFLDGAVRFQQVLPHPRVGPVVIDPVMPGTVLPEQIMETTSEGSRPNADSADSHVKRF